MNKRTELTNKQSVKVIDVMKEITELTKMFNDNTKALEHLTRCNEILLHMVKNHVIIKEEIVMSTNSEEAYSKIPEFVKKELELNHYGEFVVIDDDNHIMLSIGKTIKEALENLNNFKDHLFIKRIGYEVLGRI